MINNIAATPISGKAMVNPTIIFIRIDKLAIRNRPWVTLWLVPFVRPWLSRLANPLLLSGSSRSPKINVINSQLTAEPQAQPLKILALRSVNISGIFPKERRVSALQKLPGHLLCCVWVVLWRIGNTVIAPNNASTVNEIISHTLCIGVNFTIFLK